MIYIDKVHYKVDNNGNELYIESVKWTDNLYENAYKECSKQGMINYIKKYPNNTKTKYYRYGSWCVGEDVRVIDNQYLRTDSNDIKSDNLGNLPRY